MTDVSYIHYGVRYPNGQVSDFSEDREEAVAELDRLIKKDVAVELVTRKIGFWKGAKHRSP